MSFLKNLFGTKEQDKLGAFGAISDKQRYKNVMYFAKRMMLAPQSTGGYAPRLFTLMRMYVDRMNLQFFGDVIETKGDCPRCPGFFWMMFEDEGVARKLSLEHIHPLPLAEPITVKLGFDSVMASIWSSDKLADSMIAFGEDAGESGWQQQRAHLLRLYLPFGITEVTDNGNHSVCTGVLKRTGEVVFQANSDNVSDMSEIFREIDCDGEQFFYRESGEFVTKVRCFDAACIFGIGKMIVDNDFGGKVAFKGVPASQYRYTTIVEK